MAKKKNDQNFISELLGKLKASYADPGEQNERHVQKDTSDAEFQKQLQAMLNKSTPEKSVSKKEAKASSKAPKAKKAPAPTKASLSVTQTNPQKAPKEEATKKAAIAKQEEDELFLPSDLAEEFPEESAAPVVATEAVEIPVMVEVMPEVIEESRVPQPTADHEPSLEEPIAPPMEEIKESTPPMASEKPEPRPEEQFFEPLFEEKQPVPKKPQKDFENDTIVIRPKQVPRKQEAIVIRPRPQEKPVPAPHRVETEISKEPIRIGRKEESSSVKPSFPNVKQEAPVQPSPTVEKTVEPKKSINRTVAPSVTATKAAPAFVASPTTSQPQPTVEASPAPEAIHEEPLTAKSTPVQKKPTATAGSFSEQIYQKTGLSDEDLELLFELGYDGELSNLVGAENLKKLKSENLRKRNRREEARYPTAMGYRGKEYTEKQDRSGILAAYIHDRNHLIARLILTALAALCLLFIDVPALRGARLMQISLNRPLLFPIMGILLLIAAAAFSAKQLWAGAKSLFGFRPSPYSICGILLIPTLLYDILALFLSTANLPVNFLVALAILSTVLCDVFRLWGELRVFRLLSQEGEKHVLESVALRKKKMKYGNKIVKILNDDIDERFYRITNARETTGFFRRFNTENGSPKHFAILLFTALVIPMLLSLGVAVYTLSFSSAANAFITFLILGAPLSAMFGVFYPLFHANRILSRHKCALVGNESVKEYSAPKTLILNDSDVFHTEKCTEIALNEGGDFQNDMRLAAALFSTVGNTLEHLSPSVNDSCEAPNVTLLRILENGVEATVDDRHLLAGDASFLKRYGIRTPKESSDRVMRRTENVSVMYVAVDGVLKLHYEIDYSEKLTLEKMAEALSESKTAIAVRSYDPNINSAFVQKIRDSKKEPLRVIKPGRYESDSTLDLVDTGAVSLDTPEKTLCALQAAAKVSKLQSLTMRLQLIATLLGCLAAFVFKIFEGEFFGISSILLYHLFWIAVTFAATHIEITEDKIHLLK